MIWWRCLCLIGIARCTQEGFSHGETRLHSAVPTAVLMKSPNKGRTPSGLAPGTPPTWNLSSPISLLPGSMCRFSNRANSSLGGHHVFSFYRLVAIHSLLRLRRRLTRLLWGATQRVLTLPREVDRFAQDSRRLLRRMESGNQCVSNWMIYYARSVSF